MKILFAFLTGIALLSTDAYGTDCTYKPTIEGTGHVIGEATIEPRPHGIPEEAVLHLKARVLGSSWRKKGSEAAVVTVFIDGAYNQDIILFAGGVSFEYVSALGPIDFRKAHSITLVSNRKHSARNVGKIEIISLSVRPAESIDLMSESDKILYRIAHENAPFIHVRPETIGRFSDIPMLTYFELLPESDDAARIRYTTIFTNEDGGTNSQALLARWGRLTDIEWVYEIAVEVSGRRLSESIQGPNHQTLPFDGSRLGEHPLIFNSTVNNNFTATGCSPLRLSPKLVAADLAYGSRETVMDAHPWTYRIMAEEAEREGRIAPGRLGPNIVDDPRNYLYVEVEAEMIRAAIAVEIPGADRQVSSSDWAFPQLRVDRNGYIRIAVHRPAGVRTWPSRIRLACYGKNGSDGRCEKLRPVKIVALDERFRPVEKRLSATPVAVPAGGTVSFNIPSN